MLHDFGLSAAASAAACGGMNASCIGAGGLTRGSHSTNAGCALARVLRACYVRACVRVCVHMWLCLCVQFVCLFVRARARVRARVCGLACVRARVRARVRVVCVCPACSENFQHVGAPEVFKRRLSVIELHNVPASQRRDGRRAERCTTRTEPFPFSGTEPLLFYDALHAVELFFLVFL